MTLHLTNMPLKLGRTSGKLLSAVKRPVSSLLERRKPTDAETEAVDAPETGARNGMPADFPEPDLPIPIALQLMPQNPLDAVATIFPADDADDPDDQPPADDDDVIHLPDARRIDSCASALSAAPYTQGPALITGYNRAEDILSIEYIPVFNWDGDEIEPDIRFETAANGTDTHILLNGAVQATVQGVTGLTEDDIVLMAEG